MFETFRKPTELDLEIDRLTKELKNNTIGSDEYLVLMDMITKLHKLKNETESSKVSKDTMIMAGTNLLGILLILSTEREHVITTKALGLLQRTKN